MPHQGARLRHARPSSPTSTPYCIVTSLPPDLPSRPSHAAASFRDSSIHAAPTPACDSLGSDAKVEYGTPKSYGLNKVVLGKNQTYSHEIW